MVGILTALSAVALVQYGKYKRDAGQEVASAQSQFESENCIGVPDRKQCLCDKGLGEALGLDSEDCCPLGQTKDSNGICVARLAQASSPQTQNPPPKNPPALPTCDIFSISHTHLLFGGTPTCTCPEGRQWKIVGASDSERSDGMPYYECACTSFQNTDPDAPCFACFPKLYNPNTRKCECPIIDPSSGYCACPNPIGRVQWDYRHHYWTCIP